LEVISVHLQSSPGQISAVDCNLCCYSETKIIEKRREFHTSQVIDTHLRAPICLKASAIPRPSKIDPFLSGAPRTVIRLGFDSAATIWLKVLSDRINRRCAASRIRPHRGCQYLLTPFPAAITVKAQCSPQQNEAVGPIIKMPSLSISKTAAHRVTGQGAT
jgi:hypothetical protein